MHFKGDWKLEVLKSLMNAVLGFSDWLWNIPMLVILVGGGIFLTCYLGFFQFRYLGFILKETFGKIFKKPEGEGTVSAFQAATAALASSIGAANIVGVPVAIAAGGPGAVFWMWVTALVGFATKFSEIALGIKYRQKNSEGEYVGGPMYYLSKSALPFLGPVFAFFLMIEIAPSISTQTVSIVQSATNLGISKNISAIIVLVIVALVVYGGIKRIAQVTEKMVPLMALIYAIGALIIIFSHLNKIPGVFAMIFKNAFTPTAPLGGFLGATMAQGIRNGVARGAYSNEAGMGTAPIAHSTAITDHPARQGFWGVYEITMDTLVVCTLTALVVLSTGVWTELGRDEAGKMMSLAFQNQFGNILGGGILSLCLLLFVLSTVIVIVFYGAKQAEFLFGQTFSKIMVVIYLLSILAGAFLNLTSIYKFLDILLAAVIIPNIIGLVLFRKEIRQIKDNFFSNPNLYPGAKKQLDREEKISDI